jgi:RNA methyltransferase, TrmH family
MIAITSNQNPLIKEVKMLKERKHREDKKLYFIEGIRFVDEAIKENTEIVKVFVSQKLEEINGGKEFLLKIEALNVESYLLTEKLFKEIADTENPQGVLALIRIKTCRIEDLSFNKGFLVILDTIQDPGNMGTIIRTADAAGAAGVIISKGSVDIYNPKVLRATMGSIFHVPICFFDNMADLIAGLRKRRIKVFAAHLNGNSNYFEQDMRESVAFVIGNEANGISGETALLTDKLVKIPMPGRAESLNASIAAALLMFEAVRQRTANI